MKIQSSESDRLPPGYELHKFDQLRYWQVRGFADAVVAASARGESDCVDKALEAIGEQRERHANKFLTQLWFVEGALRDNS